MNYISNNNCYPFFYSENDSQCLIHDQTTDKDHPLVNRISLAVNFLPAITTITCLALHYLYQPHPNKDLDNSIKIAGLNELSQEDVGELRKWVQQSQGQEKADRASAMQEIIACDRNKSKKLTLANLHLSTLPIAISKLSFLRILDLNNTGLTALPKDIGEFSELKALYLACNPVKKLPDSIGNLSSLIQINLRNTELESLPKTFGNLCSLQIALLQNNKMTTLPDSFGKLRALQECYLHNNLIQSLPHTIGSLFSLRILSVENNRLRTLPNTIGQLTNVEKLYINKNELISLPESIEGLRSLQYFYCNNNLLAILPESFASLPENCTVDLRHNLLLPEYLHKTGQKVGNRFFMQVSYYRPAFRLKDKIGMFIGIA